MSTKNIWVAAGDGDLSLVQFLIESHAASPNQPDPFTYTPMHAAASYGHLHVLDYLVSHGGDVNVTDSDGDTPIYTVENVDTARWLVDHGATIDRRNSEGISPIDHLNDDFPHVAAFLQSLAGPSPTAPSDLQLPSQHDQNIASEALTSALLASVEDVMNRATAEGRDPEDELRQVVSRAVLEGVVTGYQMTEDGADRTREPAEDSPAKRPRTNGS